MEGSASVWEAANCSSVELVRNSWGVMGCILHAGAERVKGELANSFKAPGCSWRLSQAPVKMNPDRGRTWVVSVKSGSPVE